MSAREQTQGAPPVIPPGAGGGGGWGGDADPNGEHRIQVSRNVPPKRVMVRPGATITIGGKTYSEGETLLLQGPEADNLEFPPFGPPAVVIVSHEEINAWNGKEGRDQADAVLGHVDRSHARVAASVAFQQYLHGEMTAAEMHKEIQTAEKQDAPERTHDHGFGKYTHADGPHGTEMDITKSRQRLAREHLYDPQKPDTMTDDQAGLSGGKE